MPEVVYISYNTDTRGLPDIYTHLPSGVVHIYQAKHSCLCYNLRIYVYVYIYIYIYIYIYYIYIAIAIAA